jgi:hypothetical protein
LNKLLEGEQRLNITQLSSTAIRSIKQIYVKVTKAHYNVSDARNKRQARLNIMEIRNGRPRRTIHTHDRNAPTTKKNRDGNDIKMYARRSNAQINWRERERTVNKKRNTAAASPSSSIGANKDKIIYIK